MAIISIHTVVDSGPCSCNATQWRYAPNREVINGEPVWTHRLECASCKAFLVVPYLRITPKVLMVGKQITTIEAEAKVVEEVKSRLGDIGE